MSSIGEQLTFAGVQAGANLQAELTHTVTNGDRAVDRPARAVERREHPITERLDELAPVALDLLAHERVVPFEQRPPSAIAQLGGAIG